MPEDEGRKGDRSHDRFQRPRRHVDDQSANLSAADALKLPRDRLDMLSADIELARGKSCKRLVHERPKIGAQ